MNENNYFRTLIQEARRFNELLREVDEETEVMGGEDVGDGNNISDVEYEAEKNEFMASVNSRVEFGDFKVYEEDMNVEWSGVLLTEEISWKYSLDDQVGCYIMLANDKQLQLTDETLDMINKLRVYYDTWQTNWEGKLANKSGGEGEGAPQAEVPVDMGAPIAGEPPMGGVA